MLVLHASIVIEDSSSSDNKNDRPAKKMDLVWIRRLREFKVLQTSWKPNMEILSTEEALDVKKHDSMERPPPGTIWGGTSKEARRTSVAQATSEAMSEAFTNMATSLTSAFGS